MCKSLHSYSKEDSKMFANNILPEEKANTKCDLITGREYRNPKKIIVASIFEESDNRKQPKWIISHPPHIIIASPVALNHMLATGSLQADAVKFLKPMPANFLILVAKSSFEVIIIPPSPPVEIILSLQKLHTLMSPNDPTYLSFIFAPCA